MNIVFLSNEKMPIVIENGDRRHYVLYTPPTPPAEYFDSLNEEVADGGIAALHHYLLSLDLGDFRPWSRPPMTQAKQDLIDLGMGSEERFMREWQRGEIDARDGLILPFCPCLGSSLYRVYEDWCKRQGEFRPRPANHFLNFFAKQPGWSAAKPENTWSTLKDKAPKNRKMVVPSPAAVAESIKTAPAAPPLHQLHRELFSSKAEWLTACFFAFEDAISAR